MQYPDKTLVATYDWKHFFQNDCDITLKNICKSMQYLDLLLQHPYVTITTYLRNIWNTWNIHLQHREGEARADRFFGHRVGIRWRVAASEHQQHWLWRRAMARERGASEGCKVGARVGEPRISERSEARRPHENKRHGNEQGIKKMTKWYMSSRASV
jgi:hypothetical protein